MYLNLVKETMTGQESTKGEMEEAKQVAKKEQTKINQKKKLIEEELSSIQPTVTVRNFSHQKSLKNNSDNKLVNQFKA